MSDRLSYVSFNNRVIALDRRTGSIVWDWKAGKGYGHGVTLPVSSDVIVSIDGYTYCLDANSGSEKWFNPMSGFGIGPACLSYHPAHPDRIFLGFNRRVAALDRHTGQIGWDWTGRAGMRLVSISAGESEIIVTLAGYTWALNPSSGSELWHNPLSGYGTGAAVVTTTHDHSIHNFGAQKNTG